MIPYLGHTRHAIKAPHKPIKQGYKLWKLGDLGYIYSWLWYSKAEGTEGLDTRSRPRSRRRSRPRSSELSMADTQALVISLAKSLPDPAQGYTLYLDNLFNNIPLAHALAQLKIGIMGTARVNALGLPLSIKQLKDAKGSLKWGHLKTAIANDYPLSTQPEAPRRKVIPTNCCLWQDNNQVLGMIIYNYYYLMQANN